jgi:hypothetical protein
METAMLKLLLNIQIPISKAAIEQYVKDALPKLCGLVKTVNDVRIEFQSSDEPGFSVDLTVLTVDEELANTSISFDVLMNIILGALKNPRQIHTLKFAHGPNGWSDFQCFIVRQTDRECNVRLQFAGAKDRWHNHP